jgi:hypothetical protein
VAAAVLAAAAAAASGPAATAAEIREGASYEAVFPTALERGAVVVRDGEHWVSVALRGARGRPVVDGRTALVEDALPGVSVGWIAGAVTLKEGLILERRRTARRFAFTIRTSRGLSASPRAGGSIVFADAQGGQRFAFPAAFMFDSADRPDVTAVRSSMRRVREGSYVYTLRPDAHWLDAPGRRFPVVVDPSISDLTIPATCTGSLVGNVCTGRPEDPVAVCSGSMCTNLTPVSGTRPHDLDPVGADLTCLVRLLIDCLGLPVYTSVDPEPLPDPLMEDGEQTNPAPAVVPDPQDVIPGVGGAPVSTDGTGLETTGAALAGAGPTGSSTQGKKYPSTGSQDVPIVYVHGYDAIGRTPSDDCGKTFGPYWQALQSYGHRGGHYTVGFYAADTNCWDYISRYGSHSTHHPVEHVSGGHDRDANIRHLGYHLAWYLHNQFGRYGTPVKLVGHSMGGLIIRYALAQSRAGHPSFPTLRVPEALTLGTPHSGTGMATICGWRQCNQMSPGSKLQSWLANHAKHPDGQYGTDWTTMGAHDDDFVTAGSAVAMDADHKVRYFSGQYIGHLDYMRRNGNQATMDVEWRDYGLPWKNWYSAPGPGLWSYYALAHWDW